MANRRRKELTDIEEAKRAGAKALEDAKAGRIQREESENEVRGYAEIPRLEDYTGGNSPVNRPSVAVDNSGIPILGNDRTVEPIGGNRDYSYEIERLAREAEQQKYANLTQQDRERVNEIDADMRRLGAHRSQVNDRRISGLSSERERLLGQNLSQNRQDQSAVMDKWLDSNYKMTDSELKQARQIISDYENNEYKNSNVYDLTEDEQNRQSQINALRDKVSKERAAEYGVMNATINPILTAADNDFYGWTVDDLKDELNRTGDVTSQLDPDVKAYVGQLQNEIQDLQNKLNSRNTVYSTGDAGVDELTGATTSYKNAAELRRDIEDKQKQMYKLMLESVRGDNGPDYDSYALRKANAQKQNPVAYTGADMATRMLESAAIQNAVGSNGFAADMLVDALTDTAPEYAANRAAGMSAKDAGNQAFSNAMLNTALDAGAWGMSNLDEIIPTLRRANVDEVAEEAVKQSDVPKVDPAELAKQNEIDVNAKVDNINQAVDEIESLSKQIPEEPKPISQPISESIPSEITDYVQKRAELLDQVQSGQMSTQEVVQSMRSINAMDEYMNQKYPEYFENGTFNESLLTQAQNNPVDNTVNPAYAESVNGGVVNGGEVDRAGNKGNIRSEEPIPGRAELSPDMDGRRSYTGADGRTFNLRDVVDEELSKRMDEAGINNFGLRNTSGQTEEFSKQLAEAKANNTNGRMVSGKTPEELTDAILFSDDARTCGVAIEPDGNIVAVHKNPSNKQRGAVDDMLITARANGGDRLDCYGRGLVRKYEQDGFVPVARVEWNEKFRPDDWGDNPPEEIYVMMKDARSNEQVLDDIKNGAAAHKTSEELDNLPYFSIDEYGDDAYDEALKYRDSLIDGAPEKGAFSNGGDVTPEEPPIDLTRGANGDEVERGLSKRVRGEDTPMKVEGVADEVQADFVDNPDLYKQLKNSDTQALANDIYNSGDKTISINGKVYKGDPETKFRALLEEKNPASLPLGHQLAKDYSAAGNYDMAAQIYRDMGEKLTEAGQFTQASILAMMKNDPLTAMQYAQKELDAINRSGAEKFGKKWKDMALTPEEIQAFNSITPGDTEAIKALYDQIGARLGKEYPTTFMEKLLEGRKVAMLFNVRTNVRNVGANIPTLGMRWISDRVAALGEGAAHLINPNFQRSQAITGSGIKGRKLANEIFNSDKVQALIKGQSGKYEIPELKNSLMKDRQMFKGTPVSKWINRMTNGGIEKVNKKLFGKEGVESGLETIRNATYKMLDLGDSPFVKENFVERLGSYIHANNIKDIADVPDDAIQLAWEEAMKATYKDNSWAVQMLKGIKTGIEKIPGVGKPLSQAAIPFLQAPGNIAARMVDYSPIKATKGIADIIAGAARGSDEAVRKGIDEAAKGLTGSGLIILGMKLRESGLITGDYSDDKDQKNFEKQNGFIPWALHIGDKYFQYDWAQPFAEPLIVGTLLQDAISNSDQYDNEILRDLGIENEGLETALGVAWEGGKAAVNSWFNASPLQGLAELMSGGYNGTDIAQNIVDAGVSDFAGALIPSIVNASAKTADTTQRQTYDPSSKLKTFINQQQAKIPGLSDNLPAKYDTFGEKMQYAGSTGEAFAQRFLIPGNYGVDSNDPVDKAINDLFNSTNDARVFPTTAPNKVGDKTLTAQESSAYQRDMGARSKQMAEAFINSDLYKALTDEERVDALNEIYGASKAITERDMFGKEISNSSNFAKAAAAFDTDKENGILSHLSAKYNQYGLDPKVYQEMIDNNEDFTPYEGYKDALATYSVDDNAAYRTAYASGQTQEQKLANFDNEVQYQAACKEVGLDPDGKATRLAWDSALHASADPMAALQKAAANKEAALNTGFVSSDGSVNQAAYDKAVSVLGDDLAVLSNYASFKDNAKSKEATRIDQYIPMVEAIPGLTYEQKGQYAYLYGGEPTGKSAQKALANSYETYYLYRLLQNAPDLNENGKAHDTGDRIKYLYNLGYGQDKNPDMYNFLTDPDMSY